MKSILRMFIAVCFLFGAAGVSHADSAYQSVGFNNTSNNAVWVTIYRGGSRRDNVAHGCVAAGKGASYMTKKAVQSSFPFYVLVEVKADKTSCAVHENVSTVEDGRAYSNRYFTIQQTNVDRVKLVPVN